MKNTIQLSIIILSLIFFASCSQVEWEQDNKPISPIYQGDLELQLGSEIAPQEVSLDNARINFLSAEAFEELAAHTKDQNFVAHFKSMIHGKGEYRPDPNSGSYVRESADDYLQGFIFNSDGIFQLEHLIFKVDVKEKTLRFLAADKIEQLPALINGRDAADIQSVSAQYELGLDNEMAAKPIPVVCWMCLAGSIVTQPADLGGAVATRVACALCKLQLGDDEDEEQKR